MSPFDNQNKHLTSI